MPLPSATIPSLVALLIVLVFRWLVTRFERVRPDPGWRPRPWRETRLVMLGALVAQAPLLGILPRVLTRRSLLPADAIGHAGVAHAIAQHGLPHGWVDAYYGGFPFGPHYQSVPILLLSAVMRLGVDPVVATNLLGVLGILAVPVVYAGFASRAGASAWSALLGALALAWVAAIKKFVGGPGVYLDQGLFSQALATPVILATAGVVVLGAGEDRQRTRWAPLFGALSMACHAQAMATLITATLPVCLLLCGPHIRRRWLEAVGGALVLGAAEYGPGVTRFRVPFSWPTAPTWRILGFAPQEFWGRLVEGQWLDMDRAPVLTVAVAGALCLLLLLPSRAGWAALGFFAAVCGFSAAGQSLSTLGPLGLKLVEVYSPVRLMIYLPLAAAVVLTVSTEEVMVHLRQVAMGLGWSERNASRTVGAVWLVGLSAVAWIALPERLGWARERGKVERVWSGIRQCGPETPAGFDADLVASWVSELRGGRLAVDQESFPLDCPGMHGLDARASLPLGIHVGGPGTHVGIMSDAFGAIRPADEGSALRAETMGVRWVLLATKREPTELSGWRVRKQAGRVVLLERLGGTDEIGKGCFAREWSGSDQSLRDGIREELRQPKNLLDRPEVLTVLRETSGALEERALPSTPGAAGAARVERVPREPGAYEARIDSPAPVGVVVRATYVPEWRVTVDGNPVTKERVAPGFVAVRVPAGKHLLVAEVSLPRGYWLGLLGALTIVLGGVFRVTIEDRWRRWARAR
jgi:hypothetical protein